MIFDYRLGIPSTQYAVQLVTQNITDYGFYERAFSANDTNWHTEVVYFPEAGVNAPASQKFAQSFGAVKPWRPDAVGEILIPGGRPVPHLHPLPIRPLCRQCPF